MTVTDEDVSDKGKLKYENYNICNEKFKVGQSYELIRTKRKSKLIIHTDCIRK